MNPGDIDWSAYFDVNSIQLYEHTSAEELIGRVKNAEIIVVNKTVVSREVIDACSDLKCICVSATGVNNVDIVYAAERGVSVCNAANYSNSSVAQHVLAMVLHCTNNVAYYNETVHKGRWQANRDFTYYDNSIEELSSLTIGFIGYGSLGQATAKLFKAFGCKIIIKEYPHRALKIDDPLVEVVNEESFFKRSDVISIHTPLTVETKEMVNEAFLQKMKPSSIIINTSRGGVIREDHLAKALKKRWIKAACIDVLQQEPPENSPLIGMKNCIITPHQAWASKQARMRLMRIVSDNIKAFKNGGIQNKVN